MRKSVQISNDLFMDLVRYFILELPTDELYSNIVNGMNKKVDAIIMHDLYEQYKTAPSEVEREKARQEYLDRRGVSKSFRW